VVTGAVASLLLSGAAYADDVADEQLVHAAYACDERGVVAALDHGAAPDAELHWRPPKKGFFGTLFPGQRRWTTPQHEAVSCALEGKDAPLVAVLEAGAPVDLATKDHSPVLHQALAAAGRGERRAAGVAAMLLERGARPLDRYRGRAAAHALYGAEPPRTKHEAAAEALLLDAGVPEVELVCAAAEEGDVAALDHALGKWPETLQARCTAGSPLLAALGERQLGAARTLLEAGAAVDASSRRIVGGTWLSPLQVAVASHWSAGVALLLDHGVSPEMASGPAWSQPVRPLETALRIDSAAEREAMVTALVAAGASRTAWAPTDEGPWRSVFDPGDGLPDLRGERALNEEEAAIAAVSARQRDVADGVAGPGWADALDQWGPPTLAQLWQDAGLDELPPRLGRGSCSLLPEVSELKKRHGKPARSEGRWAQRWTWPDAEAVVVRERAPGRWALLRVTGAVDAPCQALVGQPVAAAMLMLGPPHGTTHRRLRWGDGVYDVGVEALIDQGVVVGWEQVYLRD